MGLLIGFFILSIAFSFLCSILEAVILSVTPSYIKRKEQEDPKTGALLKELKQEIDRPLSGILTLNTIAHTVGAIGVGAQAGNVFGSGGMEVFGFEIAYESIIATVMTLAVLFLSEIIPKTIGANSWQKLAPVTARALRILTLSLYPFVWLSTQLTKLLKKDKNRSVFSKQDFAAMAEVVSESGVIPEQDFKLIKNLLQYDDLTAKDVMTPRKVMVMANEEMKLQEYYDANKPFIFSRIPLFQETRDNVTGIMLKDELLLQLVEGKGEEPLSSIRREVVTVQEGTSLRQAFELLNDRNGHLGLVVDEYGSAVGLVTLEDIIETLFGLEIMDETDKIEDLQKYARQKWEARAKKLGLIE